MTRSRNFQTYVLETANYSSDEILRMRNFLAEREYDTMPMSDICAIAYKQIHGDYATRSEFDIIKDFIEYEDRRKGKNV